MNKLRLKICCIQNLEEAQLAIKYGATELGFVSEMPSGPGVISENNIAEIIQQVKGQVECVLLTSKRRVEEIFMQQVKCNADAIQLCDQLEKKDYAELKAALPDIDFIHVIHVNGEQEYDEALKMQHHVDVLLLDSGSKTAATKVLGGTGQTHDWAISRRICENVNVPVFLAGGLTPENVKEAVQLVQPDGVDICTGVRTEWVLDEGKLKALISALE